MSQENSSGRYALHVSAASRSDRGRVREQNEDTLALCEPSDQMIVEQLGYLYLLADGAGGHAAGEVASRVAVETIASVYYDQGIIRESVTDEASSGAPLKHSQDKHEGLALPRKRIQQAFLAAHMRILQEAATKHEYSGMATTCIGAVVKGTQLLIAHLGDSRAYLLHTKEAPPTIIRLTTDHSMVTELTRAGVITPEQMQASPARHIILRSLGGRKQDDVEPDIIMREVQSGEYVVLCCDGLWNMVSEAQIARVVSRTTPQAACNELVDLANEAGGEDNISVVVIAFT
jgi:protein phosphatase